MTEAASQHTDGIGELTASLCKRSPTSPRCVLLPGPAGPFLLKDAARPQLASHTDDWIAGAKILRTARNASAQHLRAAPAAQLGSRPGRRLLRPGMQTAGSGPSGRVRAGQGCCSTAAAGRIDHAPCAIEALARTGNRRCGLFGRRPTTGRHTRPGTHAQDQGRRKRFNRC